MPLDCPHCSLPVAMAETSESDPHCSVCGGALSIGPTGASDVGAVDPSSSAAPSTGGRFELLERVGAGSFGAVWKARDRQLGRLVALKLLHPGVADSGQALERFQREARTVAQLRHPGIVSVHEVFELSGRPVMVSDLVHGVTIDRFREGRPLAAREAARLIRQAAEALDYAHSMGVVHRDIKPANLMIEPHPEGGDSRLVVLDFGLAMTEELGATLTTDGQMLGTPAYMSPEQALGSHRAVDRRSDVYSLGVVLYELLTGVLPFHGGSASILQQLLHVDPKPPRIENPDLPRDLESICLKAMAKSARDRYASARELAEDLGRFLEELPVVARPLRRGERLARWVRRNPVTATLGGVIVLLLISVAVVATVSAFRLQRERDVALDNLYTSNLAEARARRVTSFPGRHFESLRALDRARARRPSLEVRNETIAVLPLVDLEVGRRWRLRQPGSEQNFGVAFDQTFSRCAVQSAPSGGPDSLRVIALPDSAVLACLPPEGRGVQLSPEGRFLFTHGGRGDPYRLQDLLENRALSSGRTIAWNSFDVFSADGSRATFCLEDGSFVVLALPSGLELHRWKPSGLVNTMAIDPQGRRVAFNDGEGWTRIKILDLESGLESTLRPEVIGAPWSWSPDGSRLLVALDNSVEVLEVRTGVRVPLVGVPAETQEGLFNPTGDLIVTRAWDGRSRLWDPATGAELVEIPGQYVRWSLDGRRLAYASGSDVGWWDVARGQECRTRRSLGEIGDGPYDAPVSADGRFCATASDDGARVWDMASGEVAAHLETGRTIAVGFDPESRTLFTMSAVGVRAWPLDRDPIRHEVSIGPPRTIVEQSFTSGGVTNAITPDAHWAVGQIRHRRALRIDLDSGDTLSVGPHAGVDVAAISPDGAWIATGTKFGSGIRVWDARTRALRLEIAAGSHACGIFSANGRWMVTQSTGHPTQLWAVPTFELRRALESPVGCQFLGPGDVLAVSDVQNGVRLTDTESGREFASLISPRGHAVSGVSSSPGGEWIVLFERYTHVLEFWDLSLLRTELTARDLDWGTAVLPESH